jgi:hypothetical protein
MLLKNIESYMSDDVSKNSAEQDIMSDIRYICKSCSLITESLQKGCDVMQMSNGDIIVTELKPVTFQYTWDDKKGKLIRSPYGNRARQTRPRKARKALDAANEEFKKVKELA